MDLGGVQILASKNSEHRKKALMLMPWATQTNAKRLNLNWGPFMPSFIKRANGCRMWDLDDREYIDYRCALGPVILGYQYPAVDSAVQAQMRNGVLFSMASPLEYETARAIMENTAWVEQLHFMKTGADACTACTRLARAYTGREHILTSGYHGYHDCFALSWPHHGAPKILNNYVHEIVYGDLKAVEKTFEDYGSDLAAAIVAPYEWNEDTGDAYLKALRQKCDENGTLLIFDEVLTGFRLARGGAQEYYGVTPDLAAYAKAMANGYPVSAYGGKREYMQTLEKTVITTTYAGETLSLAASKATMQIMRDEPVHDHIFRMGTRLLNGFSEIIKETGAPAYAAGLPPAPYVQFNLGDQKKDEEWLNRMYSLLFERGIFPAERWFINYSHQAVDIDETLEKTREALMSVISQQ